MHTSIALSLARRRKLPQSRLCSTVSSTQTNAIAAVGALHDQELMAQGKDFTLLSCRRSEAGWHGEKQGDEAGKHGSSNLHAAALQIQLFRRERTFW
jgi:hypothetical protein